MNNNALATQNVTIGNLTFTLQEAAFEIKSNLRASIVHAAHAGEIMGAIKETLPYGHWKEYVATYLPFSLTWADKLIQLAAELPIVPYIADMGLSKAVALLEVPADEREEFIEANHIAEASTRETKRLIAEKNKAERESARLTQQINEATEEASKARLEASNARQEAERYQGMVEKYNEAIATAQAAKEKAERDLEGFKAAASEPEVVVKPPEDYEELKASVERERRRADDMEQYAAEQEERAKRAASDMRRAQAGAVAEKESNDPADFAFFAKATRDYMARVGLLPNMSSRLRGIGPDDTRAYLDNLNALARWAEQAIQAVTSASYDAPPDCINIV